MIVAVDGLATAGGCEIVLAADLDTPFAVRIGVGAIFEDLGPEGLLADLIQPIVDTLVGSDGGDRAEHRPAHRRRRDPRRGRRRGGLADLH